MSDEQEPVCDCCGQPASYELLDRLDGADMYVVEKRLCAACAGVEEEDAA